MTSSSKRPSIWAGEGTQESGEGYSITCGGDICRTLPFWLLASVEAGVEPDTVNVDDVRADFLNKKRMPASDPLAVAVEEE